MGIGSSNNCSLKINKQLLDSKQCADKTTVFIYLCVCVF